MTNRIIHPGALTADDVEKIYSVHVYYWPGDESHSELWLGYTRYHSPDSEGYVGTFAAKAENRNKAISKAIRMAKENQNDKQND